MLAWLPWLGLGVAFWPALQDLARHLAATPWSRYAIVFPFLLARCARRAPKDAPLPGSTAAVALGLGLQIAAAFAGQIRWARPGLALAVWGLLARSGVRSPAVWVLLAFCVPAPAFLIHGASEAFQAALIEPILGIWRGLGLEVLHHQRVLVVPGETGLELTRGNLALAPLLAGIGWYHQTLRQQGPMPTAVLAGLMALASLPIAALFLAIAAGAAAAGWDGLAHFANSDGPWLLTAAGALSASEWMLRRGDAA